MMGARLRMPARGLFQLGIGDVRDLVTHVPKLLEEYVLLALAQQFNRDSTSADDAAADDALSQLQVMVAKNLHPLVEVEQGLGEIMQAAEFDAAAVHLFGRNARPLELFVKNVGQSRPAMQQS